MAIAFQSQPDDAIAHFDQFDVAAVSPQRGPHLLQRLPHARLEVQRVQSVQQEHARYYLLAGARIKDRRVHAVQHSFQPGRMQVENGLHDLTQLSLRRGVRPAFHLLQQHFETLQPRLKLPGIQ